MPNVKNSVANTVEQFDDLMHCDSMETWRDLVFRLGDNLGYEQTLLAIFPNSEMPMEAEYAFLHSNYSREWRRQYDAQKLGHVDPTVSHCATKTIPLIWSPELFSSSRQKEMYEEACGHGVRSGVTLPIHGSNKELGILCFVTDAKPGKNFIRLTNKTLPQLTYFRDVIFETALNFINSPHTPLSPPQITERELECLKWCAAGKSSWDIAQILHCSEAAVNFHFSSLRHKFAVRSRQQVVVKALNYGLIDP